MSTVHHIPAEGPLLSSGADALGLIYGDGVGDAEWIAVPAARLDAAFFTLRSGVAGEFVQKFANYGLRLAIVGNISGAVRESDSLRDFVRESPCSGSNRHDRDARQLVARAGAEGREGGLQRCGERRALGVGEALEHDPHRP